MIWVVGIGIFLFLLFAFPRPMGSLIVLCSLGVGSFFLYNKIDSENRARERALVKITISYDLDRCGPEYPLFIGIVNGSKKEIEAVSFGVEGHRVGYSGALYDSGYAGYSSDRIISAGDGWANCWSIPRQEYSAAEQTLSMNPPSALIWNAKNVNPHFSGK